VHSVLTPARLAPRDIGIDYRYEDYDRPATTTRNFNGLVPNISWSKVKADDPINTRNGYRIKYLPQGHRRRAAVRDLAQRQPQLQVDQEPGRRRCASSAAPIWAPPGPTALDDVPASQRFFAGGDNSIRGWGWRCWARTTRSRTRSVGGRYLAVGSLELERRSSAWSGAVFTDFGNAFDPDYDADWEQSAGLGCAMQTPVGPVRLDAAYALTKETAACGCTSGLGPDL
jgi:translocation and assembly module TamA